MIANKGIKIGDWRFTIGLKPSNESGELPGCCFKVG
jgi:hypothetical protein